MPLRRPVSSADSSVKRTYEAFDIVEEGPHAVGLGDGDEGFAGRGHGTRGTGAIDMGLVDGGPCGFGISARNQLHGTVRVEGAGDAVDPAPAEEFFHHRFVGEVVGVVFLIGGEPEGAMGGVIFREPCAQVGPRADGQKGGVFGWHGGSAFCAGKCTAKCAYKFGEGGVGILG